MSGSGTCFSGRGDAVNARVRERYKLRGHEDAEHLQMRMPYMVLYVGGEQYVHKWPSPAEYPELFLPSGLEGSVAREKALRVWIPSSILQIQRVLQHVKENKLSDNMRSCSKC